jgi:hypothetical protein
MFTGGRSTEGRGINGAYWAFTAARAFAFVELRDFAVSHATDVEDGLHSGDEPPLEICALVVTVLIRKHLHLNMILSPRQGTGKK